MTISIADLRAAGIRVESNEAVAIAQQLIGSRQDRNGPDQAQPPYGLPSAANVFLDADGSEVCRGCTTTPTVSEIGIFLDELLTTGSPRVPGALRYTVARTLLNVDVPPFDSLDEFSSDLARHERAERVDVVRRLLARAGIVAAIIPLTAVERRLSRASATALRRELRQADARLFQQREGTHAKPSVIDLIAMAPPPAPPGPAWPPVCRSSRPASSCTPPGAARRVADRVDRLAGADRARAAAARSRARHHRGPRALGAARSRRTTRSPPRLREAHRFERGAPPYRRRLVPKLAQRARPPQARLAAHAHRESATTSKARPRGTRDGGASPLPRGARI